MCVTLANGASVVSSKVAEFMVWYGEHAGCKMEASVVPELHTPLVFGMPWLAQFNPTIDWAERRVSWQLGNEEVILVGLLNKGDRARVAARCELLTSVQMSDLLRSGKHAVKAAWLVDCRHHSRAAAAAAVLPDKETGLFSCDRSDVVAVLKPWLLAIAPKLDLANVMTAAR